MKTVRRLLGLCALAMGALSWVGDASCAGAQLSGRVLLGGAPVVDSTVTLWSASAVAPEKLGETRSQSNGEFVFANVDVSGPVAHYVIASGGHAAKGGGGETLALLALLGPKTPEHIIINEFTTVASAFTAARFIQGESISGNPLGLRIAAMNVRNFVNLDTGGWGAAIIGPLNAERSTTLATFDTLASLVTAAAIAGDDWRSRFLKAATPTGGSTPSNTLEAMAGIARESWAHSQDLFAAFDAAYPQPKDGSRRSAPFVPYLAYAPEDFALMLCFSGGGIYAPGRVMFDADGNVWTGSNWMPGSQSSVQTSIGGGVAELAPDGSALSPPITGFTGAGIDGIGWGTGVTLSNVWASSFNGKILVMDSAGHPVATEADFPVHKLLGLMGVGAAVNGDVWIADGSDDQLVFFPGGRIKEERIVKVDGLKPPFDVVVDAQNRVWVSNSQSDTVTRFPANDPSKTETFHVGLSARALALDSKNNVWVASMVSPDFPDMPQVPDGASIMDQFRIMLGGVAKALQTGRVKATGIISMIRPDGTQAAPNGYSGDGAITLPWGLNVDGNDDVWAPSTWTHAVAYMAGDKTAGHPPGTKTGDVLHVFHNGTIQVGIDSSIDAAGDVWITNNWNDLATDFGVTHDSAQSTWGGGTGLTVIYGVAEPVKPPKLGAVRRY